MENFDAFISDKPDCFGYRRDLKPDAECHECQHKDTCLSAVWAVHIAVKSGKLPDNNYMPSELRQFRKSHDAVCRLYGAEGDQEFPTQILEQLLPLVLPPRTQEDIIFAQEWEEVFNDIEGTHSVYQPQQTENQKAPSIHENLSNAAVGSTSVSTDSLFNKLLDELVNLPEDTWIELLDKCPSVTENINDVRTPKMTLTSVSSEHNPSAINTATAAPSTSVDAAANMENSGSTAVARTATYHFPLVSGRPYERLTNDQLARELERLLSRGFYSPSALGYATIRDEFCAIHVEMNMRQQHAPRFRPTHRLKHELFTDEERIEGLDRQVIDLHWIAHSSNKPVAPANNYPTIFNNKPFDLTAAERFAQETWSPGSKATHLRLTEEMQWQLAIIQTAEIRKAWALIEQGDVRGTQVKQAGAPHVEQKLHEAIWRANKPQVAQHIPMMVSAWKARKIVGSGLAKIVAIDALINGRKPRDSRAMKRTLESLDRFLKKSP